MWVMQRLAPYTLKQDPMPTLLTGETEVPGHFAQRASWVFLPVQPAYRKLFSGQAVQLAHELSMLARGSQVGTMYCPSKQLWVQGKEELLLLLELWLEELETLLLELEEELETLLLLLEELEHGGQSSMYSATTEAPTSSTVVMPATSTKAVGGTTPYTICSVAL